MPTKSAPKTTKASSAKTGSARKTTTARKTTAKTAPKTTPTKVAPSAKTPPVAVVKEVQTPAGASVLKKSELLDKVVQRSQIKKKFAKPVVEAMLDILGGAIAEERALNLQPMGRVMPKRTKDAGKNRVVIARIRQSKERVEEAAATGAKHQAVAKAAE